MNENLKDLIKEANREVDAEIADRDAQERRNMEARNEKEAAIFRERVELALGREVLQAVGPVTFHKTFLSQSMTFTQSDQTFRLQHVTEGLVQLENADVKGKLLGHQFNLKNPTAKRDFLHILGDALKL